jgi:MoaA/NifB/PqqE/SkfB family radical SAM enzyme
MSITTGVTALRSIRSYAGRLYRRLRLVSSAVGGLSPIATRPSPDDSTALRSGESGGVEIIPPAVQSDPDQSKIQYAKAVFTNGALPSNFTITIGVAPCNYSCRFCPQSVSKPRKATWLDLDLLRKCLSEMPEEGILLNISSFSETIAAPNLVPAVRMMKEIRPKLAIVMASNGSLFKEKVVEGLIDAGLDIYQYSFDAPTRESYKELIQVDNYDKAKRNLEQIIELRNRKKSPMKIYTHIMNFKGVEQDFEQFKALWQDKVDAVLLRTVGNWGGADELGLTRKLEELGYVSAHATPEKRYPCNSIFMHFQLQPDGHYMPCLGTTPDYESNMKYSLGHANDTTWSEAWQRLSDMRQAHLRGEWDAYEACRKCNLWSLWNDAWLRDDGKNGAATFRIDGVEHAR